jgi:predicted peptidase
MIKQLKWLLFILLTLNSQLVNSQETFHFTQGLFIPGIHHYGREAIYTDSLAFQMYNQTLEKPSLGKMFWTGTNQSSKSWRQINANSNHIFESRGFGVGGYLYLTYNASVSKNVLLHIKGNSSVYVNGVLHAGDPYSSGWLYIPISLKKGENEFYIRKYFQTTASIIFPVKPISIFTDDATLPNIVLNLQNGILQGSVVIVNSSSKNLSQLELKSVVAGKSMQTNIPSIPALSSRKITFSFDASGIKQTGNYDCQLTLLDHQKTIDENKVLLVSVDSTAHYSTTFISHIDGSLQYYAVTPQLNGTKNNAALFLSVHGAGVEAIGQAKAYRSKDWGTLVAATNRRPRGFNWEDWGRIDALEVLSIAKQKFNPDPQRIYLTGHSMGGHGTWFLGATYPGNWAAIAPSAGYPTLKSYGSADGVIPENSKHPIEQLLLRAGNQSDVIKLANNYKPFGIYLFHGSADEVVPVNYARQMKKVLAQFHPDFSYYEYPFGSHWFSNESVDWNPLFDYFKWHTRLKDSAVNQIDFTTSSPGISSEYRWVSLIQQIHPLQYSNIQLNRDKIAKQIKGTTNNCKIIKFDLSQFDNNTSINILLDGNAPILYKTQSASDSIILELKNDQWVLRNMPSVNDKGPHRYGTFKDGFRNNMLFVYGTVGSTQENEWSLNKAKYDAETWYYRGNGSVDIITDLEYKKNKYQDRGVVLYGNKNTNAAWDILLNDCPIQVSRNKVIVGDKIWAGNDLGAYFIWPISGSPVASVAVVTGSGIQGMHAAFANQYFAGASGYPDFMIFSLDMLHAGANAIKMAGFFDNDWHISTNEMEQQ